jgi:hypothetical protein
VWVNALIVGLTALLVLARPAIAATGEPPTRTQYVETVEPICRAETAAHRTVLEGVEAMVQRGELRRAAPRLAAASRDLAGAVRRLAAVRRPARDGTRLERWFALAHGGVERLEQISEALAAGQRGRMQSLAKDLLREAKRANATVVGFDFYYCRMDPARFA